MLVKFLKSIFFLIPVSFLSACANIFPSDNLSSSSPTTLSQVYLLNQEINIPIGAKDVFWIENTRKRDYTLNIDVTFGRPIDIYLFKYESNSQPDEKPEIIKSFKQVKKVIDSNSISEGTYGLLIVPRGPLECIILAPEQIGLDREQIDKLSYLGFEGVYWNDTSHSRGGFNLFGFGADSSSSEEVGKNILPSETQADVYLTLSLKQSQSNNYSIERQRNPIKATDASDSSSRCYDSELDIPTSRESDTSENSEDVEEPSSPVPETSN